LKPVLVTGGAGFIGSNLADRLARDGHQVLIYDALAREGVERNLRWLQARHPKKISVAVADVRDVDALTDAAQDASAVFHLAAQVAVTTSMVEPVADFDVNVRATLTLLEALRGRKDRVPLIFASTNKVYGDLGDLEFALEGDRYNPVDPEVLAAAWARPGRSTSTRPTAAPRAPPTSTCWITPAATASHGGAAHELHLRPSPDGHRRPGMGRPLPDPGAGRRPDLDLRRRLPGPRHPRRRGRGGRLHGGVEAHRPGQRQGVQPGGGPDNASACGS
jgi:hypothetical protein